VQLKPVVHEIDKSRDWNRTQCTCATSKHRCISNRHAGSESPIRIKKLAIDTKSNYGLDHSKRTAFFGNILVVFDCFLSIELTSEDVQIVCARKSVVVASLEKHSNAQGEFDIASSSHSLLVRSRLVLLASTSQDAHPELGRRQSPCFLPSYLPPTLPKFPLLFHIISILINNDIVRFVVRSSWLSVWLRPFWDTLHFDGVQKRDASEKERKNSK
jgi:hypothetical protein